MDDLDLLMLIDDLCTQATEIDYPPPAIADLILAVREEESLTFEEVMAKFDSDVVGKLDSLCEKDLITKKFLRGKMRYSVTKKGTAYINKELS